MENIFLSTSLIPQSDTATSTTNNRPTTKRFKITRTKSKSSSASPNNISNVNNIISVPDPISTTSFIGSPASQPFQYNNFEFFQRTLAERDARIYTLENEIASLNKERARILYENQVLKTEKRVLEEINLVLDEKNESEKRRSTELVKKMEILQESLVNLKYKFDNVMNSQQGKIYTVSQNIENEFQVALKFFLTQNWDNKIVQQIQQKLQDLENAVKMCLVS